jgi:hypothetical protein
MICGLKNTSSLAATIWSCQMESVRKDIECTYGILKMRFTILRNPLQYHSRNATDFLAKMNNVVWSCCILHNLLLGYDRLDLLWTDADVLSTWYADADAEMGHDFDLSAAAHQEIVDRRARIRCRQFRATTLGRRRPLQHRQTAPVADPLGYDDDDGVILSGMAKLVSAYLFCCSLF